MSFILDALKKSENERQRTVGPSLTDAPLRRAQPERPWWAVAVAALLVVNLGVLLVVLLRDSDDAKPAGPAPATVSQVAPAQTIAPAQQPAAVPPERAPVFAPQSMQSNYPPTNPAVRSLAEEAGTSTDPMIDPRMHATMAAAAAVPPGPSLVQPIQPPSVAPLPGAATFNSVAAPGSAAERNNEVLPTAGDLAASGTALPELKLDIHVYAANPAERFVFVNMRKYLEGQTLQEGPSVEKITNDGVILNRNGLRFVLPRQ